MKRAETMAPALTIQSMMVLLSLDRKILLLSPHLVYPPIHSRLINCIDVGRQRNFLTGRSPFQSIHERSHFLEIVRAETIADGLQWIPEQRNSHFYLLMLNAWVGDLERFYENPLENEGLPLAPQVAFLGATDPHAVTD